MPNRTHYNPWEIIYTQNRKFLNQGLILQKVKALGYIQKNISSVNSIFYLYNHLLTAKESKEVKIKLVEVIHEMMQQALSKNQNMIFEHYFDELLYIQISVK
jgi:hypothetical protein